MAYLELSTTELAKTATAFVGKEISNFNGLSDGISFDVELGIKLLPKSIPLKLVFSEFDAENEIIIFEIMLNSDNKILRKGFRAILKAVTSILPEDELPEGVELEDNYLNITPAEIIEYPGIEITILDVKLKSKKLQINFEIESE
ncbi:MAG: hypothetical protein IT276_15485 [Ignavibacteriaceae bacterium]|nr:hypothetical protein [Ignavibacteriaceae bacterium]